MDIWSRAPPPPTSPYLAEPTRRGVLLANLLQVGFPSDRFLEVISRDVGDTVHSVVLRGNGWHSWGFSKLYFLDGW